MCTPGVIAIPHIQCCFILDLEAAMDLCPALIGANKHTVTPEAIRSLDVYQLQRPLWLGQGTGGYIVSKAGAAKLLHMYKATGMPEPADMFMIHRFLHLNTFVSSVSLCYTNSKGGSTSDTGTTGAPPVSHAQKNTDLIRLLELKVGLKGESGSWKLDCWVQLIELYQSQQRWEDVTFALESAWSLEVVEAKRIFGGLVDPEAKFFYQTEFRKVAQLSQMPALQARARENVKLVSRGLRCRIGNPHIHNTMPHGELR